MSTHTPGPWELIARSEASVNIEKSDGDIRSVIAEIRDGSLCEEHGDYRSNARLIAAAPQLLEALNHLMKAEAMQQGERNGYVMGVISQAIDMARVAIASAEGKE